MNKQLTTLTAAQLRSLLKSAVTQGHGQKVKQKLAWFLFAIEHERNISLTCRHFAITRSTFLRWLERFDPQDLSSLSDVSRKPKHLREPETPHKVIEIIRSYRERFPTMGKETLRKLLKEEHNIPLSASTVGRVIARHHFFFSKQASHQIKLTAWTVSKQEELEHLSNILSRPGVDVSGPMVIDNAKEKNINTEQENDSEGNTWFGPGLSALLIATSLGASLFAFPQKTSALESTSYRMETEGPSTAHGSVRESTSYTMGDDISWFENGAQSTSYQISDVPGTSSSSLASSSSSFSFAPDISNSHGTNGGGGHGPGTPVIRPPVLPPHGSSASSTRTTAGTSGGGGGVLKPAAPANESWYRAQMRRAARLLRRAVDTTLTPKAKKELIELKQKKNLSDIPSIDGRAKLIPVLYNIFSASFLATLDTLDDFPWTLVLPLLLLQLGIACFCSAYFHRENRKKKERELTLRRRSGQVKERMKRLKGAKKLKKGTKARRIVAAILVMISCAGSLQLAHVPTAHAANTTTPAARIYKGYLLTSAGAPVTTSTSIRFSYWRSADFVSSDVDNSGNINTGAANYLSWTEVDTVTPDSRGFFTVTLGNNTALPDLSQFAVNDLLNLFLQVEAKPSASANTAYELLDVNPGNTAIDRSAVATVPFAKNADFLDQHNTGTGASNIPFLDVNALFSKGVIPGGTNQDFFTIDADNSVSAGSISLNFGGTLGKVLSYDIANSRFNFNADLRIQGNLTVTGLINGININALSDAASTSLKVSSGAGLTAAIQAGSYRVNGSTTDYAGLSGVSLQNNTDNYVFFTSTGLTVNTIGFPTDKSAIPLAKVTTSAGHVTAVSDKRVLMSDDREETILQTLQPEFEGVTYKSDGSSNVGQLSQSVDEASQRNYYSWMSTRPTLNDEDVIVTYVIPDGFQHWSDDLTFTYKSQTNDATQNKMDIQVFDTNGSLVTLSGSALGLTSTSWTSQHIEFTGTPTWTRGQKMMIRMKLYSKDNNAMQLGDIKLQYVEMKQN